MRLKMAMCLCTSRAFDISSLSVSSTTEPPYYLTRHHAYRPAIDFSAQKVVLWLEADVNRNHQLAPAPHASSASSASRQHYLLTTPSNIVLSDDRYCRSFQRKGKLG
ncbi:Protein of unknown function [Pyronema omphalodes CBS 100304]|uniref:Uncharacterized protein n=1 Tax=Pyronema omphalodes (strain CBS 100304) TaxID=1076935 RepID=U4LW59_PYROM|nr:Protein of unknown function [Pyronema omphalodes CBS 100304]